MERNLHDIPPSHRLQEIEKLLKRVRSLKTLRSRVCNTYIVVAVRLRSFTTNTISMTGKELSTSNETL